MTMENNDADAQQELCSLIQQIRQMLLVAEGVLSRASESTSSTAASSPRESPTGTLTPEEGRISARPRRDTGKSASRLPPPDFRVCDDVCGPIDVSKPSYAMNLFRSRGGIAIRTGTAASSIPNAPVSSPVSVARVVTQLPPQQATPSSSDASSSGAAPGNEPSGGESAASVRVPEVPARLRWYVITMGNRVGVVRGWHIAKPHTLPLDSLCLQVASREEGEEIFEQALAAKAVRVWLNHAWVEVSDDPAFEQYIL
ncbi:hypothetical protein PUNSTDRAFT_130401 [Punctularia strigosozonata HHB-11173 SS5]|uniref:uncharacterized protein n=1 Tax=Punctularia strigosozonata (strain HHB-11173) TaxID=741275 RepID=UPI0004416EC5|nr:uncharacterized protein PUNSTDRAFT_130401 [Punctularia strigosozonata HHB-11173 SS5]EIN12130.1 hypothetical protein PUNSTDRAFT_130401 [Punctularia strigosozonata HHB-11173 SS5]